MTTVHESTMPNQNPQAGGGIAMPAQVVPSQSPEPVAVINGLVTVIEAGVALLVGMGLNLSPEMIGLVMALVVAVGNLLKTIWSRSQVTPVIAPRDQQGRALVPTPGS